MSAVFEELDAAIASAEFPSSEIKRLVRRVLAAMHDLNHELDDAINSCRAVRIAAGELAKAMATAEAEEEGQYE